MSKLKPDDPPKFSTVSDTSVQDRPGGYVSRKNEVTTFEAAEEIGVSIRTIQQWMEKGWLKGRKTSGGHRRLDAADVQKLALQRKQKKKQNGKEVCTILIIEDDPDICRLYQLMIQNWPIPTSLHFAHDGFQGLIMMGELHPHFVAVDLNIPLIDGVQLINVINEKFDKQRFRDCVVTALTPDEIEKRGVLPQECTIVPKPIDFKSLEQLITASYREVTKYREAKTS